jgi:hypothetical protein
MESVKTTVDIPEQLYRAAKIKAIREGTTLRDLILSSLAERLNAPPPVSRDTEFEINDAGFPVLRRKGVGIVSNDLINHLREQEGV